MGLTLDCALILAARLLPLFLLFTRMAIRSLGNLCSLCSFGRFIVVPNSARSSFDALIFSVSFDDTSRSGANPGRGPVKRIAGLRNPFSSKGLSSYN